MKYFFFLLPFVALGQQDKVKHFLAGSAISSATYSVVYLQTHNPKKAFWFGLASGIAAGVAKEIYDPVFDPKDLAATAAGSLSVSFTITLFQPSRESKVLNVSL